jgi:signal transduction histidine kinase
MAAQKCDCPRKDRAEACGVRTSTDARSSLSVKFAVLVAAIFGVFLITLLLVQRTQRRSLAELLESETKERSGMLTRVLELTSRPLHDFAYDYSQWDDMLAFVKAPQRDWAAINIDASLKNFDISAAWVLRVDGSIVYSSTGENREAPPPPFPLSPAQLQPLLEAGDATEFFVGTPEALLEICLAPVLPSSDTARAGKAQGWLFAARPWDKEQLRLLGDVLQCEASLAAPGRQPRAAAPNEIVLRYPLLGPADEPVADLVYAIRSAELEIVARDQALEFGLLAAALFTASIAAVSFVYRTIVSPLRTVGKSMEAGDPGLLHGLLERSDEIGHVAQAVKHSFAQREELQSLMEQRIRLGRELHDGVIQTVFAAGMSLAGARATLRQKPDVAEQIIEDTRNELNATIRTLRDFINGLEPEPLQRRTFRESVQSIASLMQGVRTFEMRLEIDDEVGGTLNASQRLHLLQITREAVSNSVRHGRADNVTVRLAREGVRRVLEIVDDGVGIEESPTSAGGRGLLNLSARARELGGELRMLAGKSGGVRVRLEMPG